MHNDKVAGAAVAAVTAACISGLCRQSCHLHRGMEGKQSFMRDQKPCDISFPCLTGTYQDVIMMMVMLRADVLLQPSSGIDSALQC